MNVRPLGRLAAALGAAVLVAASPAFAATIPNGPAASADAYGLLVDVQLLDGNVPLKQGPLARASQESPGGTAEPDVNELVGAGPIPGDGSVVGNVGVMTTIAGANGAPNAVASAEAVDVNLLDGAVKADVVRAQANTDCLNTPNATGTTFVNLVVNGVPIEQTPGPNTVIDLVVAKVILNEQRPAYDGRGILVNAIHIVSTTAGDPLFRGDVIVSHAMSTVNCTNGAGSTGGNNPVKMVKNATPSEAKAGTTVTYDAHVTNTSGSDCLVNQFIEHLGAPFEFVSTSGDFGNALDRTEVRPGGGTDLILGNGKVLGNGKTFNQTFVVKVKEGIVPGVYFNNLEILCANLGNFVKGLDAPVRIGNAPPTGQERKPQCSDGKDNDGDGKIDFGTDPGCSSPQDDDERDTPNEMPRTGFDSDVTLFGSAALLLLAALSRRLAKEL